MKPEAAGIFETITIRRIEHRDLLKVFFSNVERSIQEPGWYLTKDAPHLFNTIGRLSYPGLCAIRLYNKSESNVYAVSLPRVYKASSSSRRHVGPATTLVDIMVKVIHCQASFDTERSALAEVAPAYNTIEPLNTKDRHYALGTCSYCLDEATAVTTSANEVSSLVSAMGDAKIGATNNNKEVDAGQRGITPLNLYLSVAQLTLDFWTKFSVANTPFEDFSQRPLTAFSHPCTWRDMEQLKGLLLSKSLVGGTVVMRVGAPLTSQKVSVSDWREGVCKCLLAGRMVNWSHGDTRLSNTLLFGHRIQLIDYNHAVKLQPMSDGTGPRGSRQFVEGSLYRSLGPRLAKVSLHTAVDWTSADDLEMAMRCMEKLTTRSDLATK